MSGSKDTCSYLLSRLKWWGKNGRRGGGGGKLGKYPIFLFFEDER